MSHMPDPLLSFVKLLAGREPGERLLEVRYRTNGHSGMKQHFIPATSPGVAENLIRSLSERGDTYVGVLLRDRAQGGRRAVSSSHLLWVEIDAADGETRLLSAPAPPTAIVSSGGAGHLHAYWLLRSAVDADQLPELNRKLAGTVGGDLASVDAARILRPPATLNHKYEQPIATRLELLESSRAYDALELTVGLIDPHPKANYTAQVAPHRPSRPLVPAWRQVEEALRQIPASEYVPQLAGEELNAEGKIHCPFHGDGKERTPSLQVYPPFEWACFGCQRGGSIYDFASYLWRIPTKGAGFHELRERLAEQFGIQARKPTSALPPAAVTETNQEGAPLMAISYEHDGSHEAIENFLKDGIMLVTQYAKHHTAQRLIAQTEAARQDHELKITGRQQYFQQELTAKLDLERACAAMRYAEVNKQEFWDNADTATILDTYKDASLHADHDPGAAQAVEVIADYIKAHMGADVDEVTKGSEASDAVEPDDVEKAYKTHLETGRGMPATDGSQADRGSSSDREITGGGQQFTGRANVDDLAAELRDLHLSKAVTAAASPHTIEQVADAAETDPQTVYARHTAPEADLAGERDNLDR
jgi:hypothetical protein